MRLRTVCLITGIELLLGCAVPPQRPPAPISVEGLKLSDLKDSASIRPNAEYLIELRILTYVLDAASADELKAVYDLLSQQDIRTANKEVFAANGLAIGTGPAQEASRIAQRLYEIGAVRISQSKLLIPPEETEILSSAFQQQGLTFLYCPFKDSLSEIILPPNTFVGWTMLVRPDPRLEKHIQLTFVPSYWQRGAEDLRLRMGRQPIDFNPLEAGRVLARLEEGGFLLLGPDGKMPEQNTLGKILFFLAGRKPQVQFFVILCDKAGL